jgi:hypothetical protein
MDNNQSGPGDTRDARTGEGELPQGDRMGAPITSSRAVEGPGFAGADDPVSAVNPGATPSDYTMEEIEEGDTPLDEGMDRLIDPSLHRQPLSTNRDVLDLDGSWIQESEEPDFMDDPGTTDVIEVVENGETYFPPTDPPVRSTRSGFETVDVVGGFAGTSLEEPIDTEDAPARLQNNDDELAEQVRFALSSDSYTGDLNIEVDVEDGIVYLHGKVGSLEDVEQAEQVAGSVPGVVDVEEDLEIV